MTKNDVTCAEHCRNFSVMRSNIVFCHICCFLCEFVSIILKQPCKTYVFLHIYLLFFVSTQEHIKLQRNALIHRIHVDATSFPKETATILDFYFHFQFWPFIRHWDIILHLCSKFDSNRTTTGAFMTSYAFFMMVAAARFWVWWNNSLV